MPPYEIYALKYAGPVTSSGAFIMWMQDWDAEVERNYYLWCIKGPQATVVVDTGISPAMARQRKLAGYVSPTELLQKIGVDADRVEHVIVTHLHWDHAGGVNLFPQAKVYVQKEEFRFWMRDPIARKPAFGFYWDAMLRPPIEAAAGQGRLKLIDGDREILPGIECLLAPGHSVALQAVAVNTSVGTAILGSDCGHFFKNYQHNWPGPLIVDMVAWMRSFDKLKAKVASPELLFPGHDPLMTREYPQVDEAITRIA